MEHRSWRGEENTTHSLVLNMAKSGDESQQEAGQSFLSPSSSPFLSLQCLCIPLHTAACF